MIFSPKGEENICSPSEVSIATIFPLSEALIFKAVGGFKGSF